MEKDMTPEELLEWEEWAKEYEKYIEEKANGNYDKNDDEEVELIDEYIDG